MRRRNFGNFDRSRTFSRKFENLAIFGFSSSVLGVLAYNYFDSGDLENEESNCVLCEGDSDNFSMYAKCEMKILVGVT